jgi:hypothetical protein
MEEDRGLPAADKVLAGDTLLLPSRSTRESRNLPGNGLRSCSTGKNLPLLRSFSIGETVFGCDGRQQNCIVIKHFAHQKLQYCYPFREAHRLPSTVTFEARPNESVENCQLSYRNKVVVLFAW